MKKISQMLHRFTRDNRGSSLTVVLICMICVVLLGATLMYMAYMGYRIKVTERDAMMDFYDAAAAMDEIRAGIQEAVSDAAAASYQAELIDYNNTWENMEAIFQSGFWARLNTWTNPDGEKLLRSETQYDPSVLQSFVRNEDAEEPAAVVVTTAASAQLERTADQLRLKDVHVTYTDPETKYTTDVQSDIVISIPGFTYILSEYSISGLPEFAVIAKDSLIQSSSHSDIEGSAYVGEIDILEGGRLAISGGTVVCAGDVNVNGVALTDGSYHLSVSENASLWAGGITVNENNRVSLNGTAYVADDLDLAGREAVAMLRGKYFGFGSSDDTPSQSSAILINGQNTTLDMSGLERLMLAGYSFIRNSYLPGDADGDVSSVMGESISTRRNQTAYLLPLSYLEGVVSNPTISDGSVSATLSQEGRTKLAEWGGRLKTLYTNLPGLQGQTITYYFVDFEDPTNANKFFADYFAENQEDIETYLNSYTVFRTTLGIVETAGNTLQVKEDGEDKEYTLKKAVGAATLDRSAQQMQSTFNQLKTTLFDRVQVTNTNPYDHFVKTDEVEKLTRNVPQEFKNDDVVVGLVVDGSYVVDSTTPDTVRIIIASGDVTVTRAYSGLVISGGTITMSNQVNLTADAEKVTDALVAKDAEGRMLSSFLRDGIIENYTGESGGSGNGWDFNESVAYENWNKNK